MADNQTGTNRRRAAIIAVSSVTGPTCQDFNLELGGGIEILHFENLSTNHSIHRTIRAWNIERRIPEKRPV